jgi:hypothetical protein
MHKLILAAVLALPMTPALADVTIIGDNGGTITKSRDCSRGGGSAQCTVETLRVGPEGTTSSKVRVRTTVPGESVSNVSITGPGGETRTRERRVIWGN